MSQLAIEWSPSYLGGQRWDAQLEAIRAAVKHLTAKEVAYALDIGASQLSDALYERERKVWHPRWTHIVRAMLEANPTERSLELLRAIVDADVDGSPWTIIEREDLTIEDEVKLLRSELARFGDAGKQAAAKVGKGRARR